MTVTVKRSFSAGDHRFSYELLRDGKPLQRLFSDNEYLYAVVTTEDKMFLRRTVSDISDSEMADPQTRIVTINYVTP